MQVGRPAKTSWGGMRGSGSLPQVHLEGLGGPQAPLGRVIADQSGLDEEHYHGDRSSHFDVVFEAPGGKDSRTMVLR